MNKSKTYITTYCGQPLTLYELKNGKITYYTLNKVTGAGSYIMVRIAIIMIVMDILMIMNAALKELKS